MFNKLFYIIILIFLFYNNQFKNIKYSKYDDWIKLIDGKKIIIMDKTNYCIELDKGYFYNDYLCTNNVIMTNNYLNSTEYNILEIEHLNSKKKSMGASELLLWIVGYISIMFVYKVIYYLIQGLSLFGNFLIKKKSSATDTTNNTEQNNLNNSKNPLGSGISFDANSFLDNLYGSSIFGNSNTEMEVKTDKDPNISIDNFVGCSNIKKEVNKLINQINYENIYKENGCELPKGLLLLGPPGVGKTHLVKTIINATGMKYIFTSGSDFNKMLVGSGSSNVSKLFKKARENKPCLIFIDEADSILKKRSHNESSTTSTELGATICKFLAEMDSLKTETGVIVIFATNMDMDYIDKGMIRSGRVDQIIQISYPTFEERVDLFKMYLKDLYVEEFIDINKIAKLSYGLTGSDIKKIINLIKIRKVNEYLESNQDKFLQINTEIPIKRTYYVQFPKDEDDIKLKIIINTEDIDKEISKCILGMERERKINQLNKKFIAYHEAGHAIMAFLIKDSIIPEKICISINSKSLGYTLFPQDDDDLLMKTSIKQLLIEVMILYAGRSSEKIFLKEVTCGAEDDYMRARKILKRLLMNGMLIPEYNYIDNMKEETKMPEHIEKIFNSINKIFLEQVDFLFRKYSIIIDQTAEKIISDGSIISDDIFEIFKKNDEEQSIGHYNISELKESIENEIKKQLELKNK
jgi:ATP-dependent Zn protease